MKQWYKLEIYIHICLYFLKTIVRVLDSHCWGYCPGTLLCGLCRGTVDERCDLRMSCSDLTKTMGARIVTLVPVMADRTTCIHVNVTLDVSGSPIESQWTRSMDLPEISRAPWQLWIFPWSIRRLPPLCFQWCCSSNWSPSSPRCRFNMTRWRRAIISGDDVTTPSMTVTPWASTTPCWGG